MSGKAKREYHQKIAGEEAEHGGKDKHSGVPKGKGYSNKGLVLLLLVVVVVVVVEYFFFFFFFFFQRMSCFFPIKKLELRGKVMRCREKIIGFLFIYFFFLL